MNKPSQGQVLNAISVLVNNTEWSDVPASVLQKIIDSPKVAGRELTAYLKNGGHVTANELVDLSSDSPGPVGYKSIQIVNLHDTSDRVRVGDVLDLSVNASPSIQKIRNSIPKNFTCSWLLKDHFFEKEESLTPLSVGTLAYTHFVRLKYGDRIILSERMIQDLGGPNAVEMSILDVFRTLLTLDNAENDKLAQYFYSRDKNGVLRRIYATLKSDGWNLSMEDIAERREYFGWILLHIPTMHTIKTYDQSVVLQVCTSD